METTEKGQISIHTENIFPIIKKFLYSDHEIFLRELVSNAVDASQKMKKLALMGEFTGELGELSVNIGIDKEAKTITVSDNGLGMSADEIKKYINQIAFSGATEFVEKYQDQDAKDIIGKFGLGFYSAFMVAENVEIITKSYREDSQAARWICDGSTEYQLTEATKETRGTDIILHIAADSEEFLENNRIEGILEKYCKFLPITVTFEEKTINNTQPLWTKSPSDLTDQDYLDFYQQLYPFSEAPLFWIHLNVDYPFNLTGVLYFPKVKNEVRQHDKIQLYSRQVFITDEVKDVVPDFLMLLHGVLDSPDIPLNVSRSFLQADSNVKKINSHITKKVADKLNELFKADRVSFEKKFTDIALFVKYGMLTDEKFFDRAKEFYLMATTENQFFTLEEYRQHTQATQQNKHETLVWLYANDVAGQDSYIQAAKRRGYDVLIFDSVMDSHFIQQLEAKLEKTTLKRVDSDSIEKLIETEVTLESVLTEEQTTAIKSVFENLLKDEKDFSVSVESLPVSEMPVSITVPEFMRRMNDMSKMGGGQMAMFGAMPLQKMLVINANHSIISKILENTAPEQEIIAKQLIDLALLSQQMLTGSKLTAFVERSLLKL